jgi:predicted acetyltransferase
MTSLRLPLMKIEVVPAASEQAPVLANLLQLYAHDFSEFHDVEIGADGRFVYKHLPLYWSEPGRHPFLVWVGDELAGFVLVKKGSETSGNGNVWDMAEFFVLRAYRRRRVGTRIAHEVWKRFPGVWEVRVMEANVAALSFWTRAISEFTGKNIEPVRFGKDGESWMLFSFASTHLA